MNNQKGYVFSIVAVILTLSIFTLALTVSKQRNNVYLIENYKVQNSIEQEIFAIELVVLELLNNQFSNHLDLVNLEGFNNSYLTPNEGVVSVNLTLNDSCYNINSLVYKDLNGNFELLDTEFYRAINVVKKLEVKESLINNISDWLDSNKINLLNEPEETIFINNGINWRPRNSLAVSNEELKMIPGYNDAIELDEFFCVNLYSRKFNIKTLTPQKVSLYLPFLNIDQSEVLLNIIEEEIWLNSNPNFKTDNNIKNLKKEIEYILRRPLKLYEEKLLNNVGFKSKSINSNIVYESKSGEKWSSYAKYELGSSNTVKLVHRYGPFYLNANS